MLREFFGIGGYMREPEGYMSWQHLTFVTTLCVLMVVLALVLGRRNKGRSYAVKNRVLIFAALMMDLAEIQKIIIQCVRANDPMGWLSSLPLFLCSIHMITLPIAAFSKGRLREASLDFTCIFGVLGALLGTYAAGQNYACYPVLSLENVTSGIVHVLAGFAAIYIFASGMASMKKRDIPFTFGIVAFFCVLAQAVNLISLHTRTDGGSYNYMFMMRGDGTPYDILYNLVGGNAVLYAIGVVLLFLVYIVLFYAIYFALTKKRNKA